MSFRIKKIDFLDTKDVQAVLEIEKIVFPPIMRTSDALLQETLANQNGIHFLFFYNDRLAGCVLSLPQNDEYYDLIKYDPLFSLEDKSLYLESIGIKPEYRGLGLSVLALQELISLAQAKSFKKITMHARLASNFNVIVQKSLKAKYVRHFDNWADFGEPFDYLEIELN